MYTVTFKGFKTQQQAEEFVKWYEGQGEQDASVWFDCRKIDGDLDVDFMPVDCGKTYPLTWENDNLNAILDIQ